MNAKKIFVILSISLAVTGLQSCFDFDTPSDEFQQTEKKIDDVVYHGKVDSIPYMSTITQQQFEKVATQLSTPLHTALGGQYALRGGKDGGLPGTHAYQYQFCLGPDNYAQYHVIPHHDFPYSKIEMSSTYALDQKAYGGPMGSFTLVKNSVVPLLNHPAVDSIPELKAIYLLLYDYAAVEVADLFGPFPYSEYKVNKQENPYKYDEVRSIYMTVEANIDTICKCLKYFDSKPDWYKKSVQNLKNSNDWITNDLMSAKEGWDTWLRFANSLKLRMAMHIVKVEPDKAKKWAEEAVRDGVIEDTQSEVALFTNRGFTPPLIQIMDWGDSRLSASFESILMSLGHPFASNLFMPNSDAIINGTTNESLAAGSRLVGIRSGSHVSEGQGAGSNQYIRFSRINPDKFYSAPLYLMKLSEVCFLRAEGVIRGWDMKGSVKDFYEQGIRYASVEDRMMGSTEAHGKIYYVNMVDEYLQRDKPVDYVYVDPTGATPNMPSVTKIGVKWNEGDDNETKLEKIITQKYIAGYPYSFEAWTDMRRTGYPKVFPVLNPEEGDGSLKAGDLIRRIPFPDTSKPATAEDVFNSGLKALGGPDVQATRIWWDTDRPNF